jgi:hypothetical protein
VSRIDFNRHFHPAELRRELAPEKLRAGTGYASKIKPTSNIFHSSPVVESPCESFGEVVIIEEDFSDVDQDTDTIIMDDISDEDV